MLSWRDRAESLRGVVVERARARLLTADHLRLIWPHVRDETSNMYQALVRYQKSLGATSPSSNYDPLPPPRPDVRVVHGRLERMASEVCGNTPWLGYSFIDGKEMVTRSAALECMAGVVGAKDCPDEEFLLVKVTQSW